MNELLWAPDKKHISTANLTQFESFIAEKYGRTFAGYPELHQWSIEYKEHFWASIVEYFNLKGSFEASTVLVEGEIFQQTQWFPDATLNFAENLLPKRNDDIAIIDRNENGGRKTLTYAQLYDEVERVAASMRELGVTKGDRVAGFLPNCSESIIAMLATTSIGAVWSSCSPDFGINGVIDRLGQIQPKLLIATNGYHYAGKRISTTERVKSIVQLLNALTQLVVVEYIDDEPKLNYGVKTSAWQDFTPNTPTPLTFTPVHFSDSLYIMYSSGTTGVPKCIVHGVGGTLLQHVKELALHTNLNESDNIFYYTTCGWMMWNWVVSSLSQGATLTLFDGSPFHPTPSTLFDIAEQEQISIFGASAKYFAACDKAGLHPLKTHNLTTLNTLLSTGSPLAHETFDYLYQKVKKDMCVSSISGGTDIVSCFALGNPVLPVYRGELQCAGLGMDVAFYDERGHTLQEGKGELVCQTPFPSMPTGFWNDKGGLKYKKAYFESFENCWAHGDYGEVINHRDKTGQIIQQGIIIHGRSDAVLNPGGVRIGTAEIYRQVEKIDDVLESIAIGQQWEDDVRVILFVRLKPGIKLDNTLTQKIKYTIRANTTPRHVPAKIIQVTDIPRTISGKIVELAVRNVVHGETVKNQDALANPEALTLFEGLDALTS
ncbi:acetoacetate--CoA ligase [Alkalimarinus alittae]|uniref:Acetoacetate--CoA ligase n=1 Tax=Alkalimarinus alittae TaxID=2961619 RepID=A0ABY6MXB2_9ALTE|nr:acetoacetate--CoA ligase [Alkalimarinus alittae]UZE94463.1 acetoacetate--CoA ligase [Alkalimarinus alittae]